jgi:hypothetical protein
MLEPTALKGARWVLRGGGGSNATPLPDRHMKYGGQDDSEELTAETSTASDAWIC